MNIDTCRQEIDRIDAELIEMLNTRAGLAQQIGAYKLEQKRTSLYDPAREAMLLKKLESRNQGPLSNTHIRNIYREIISSCLSLEQVVTVAFLGPEGTFTQMAAQNHFGHSADYLSRPSIADVFASVERGKASFGVVPIENSTEGVVSQTIDLLSTSGMRVVGEQELPVEHCLLAQQKVSLANIDVIYGHQQALAQCRHWLKEHIPTARVETVASNALGAKMAAEQPGSAAIASQINAQLYDLTIVRERIEDITGNKTRFVVLGDMDTEPTGNDKTALLFGTMHKPGGLFQALKHFNDHGLDMTRLESKPLKTATWEYSFFVEFRGHIRDDLIANAVEKLRQDTTFVKHLGSFPRPVSDNAKSSK